MQVQQSALHGQAHKQEEKRIGGSYLESNTARLEKRERSGRRKRWAEVGKSRRGRRRLGEGRTKQSEDGGGWRGRRSRKKG
jgi:hypothetical protein